MHSPRACRAELYHFPRSGATEALRIDKLRSPLLGIVIVMWAISIIFWTMIAHEVCIRLELYVRARFEVP